MSGSADGDCGPTNHHPEENAGETVGADAQGPSRSPRAEGVIVVGLDLSGGFLAAHGFASAALISSAAQSTIRAALGGRAVVEPGPVDRTLVIRYDAGTHFAEDITAELMELLSRPLPLADDEHFVQSRVGSATASSMGTDDPDLLLRAAFAAAHLAMQTGVQLHTATRSMLEDLGEASELRTAMARAAPTDFEMHFQPIVDLAEARVLGYESLIRWRRGEDLLTPPAFLPAAEETSLILPIGRVGTRSALEQLARWSHPGATEPLFMSVNYSALQLSDPRLLPHLRRTLDELSLSASALWIEITEQALIDVASPAMRTISALAEMGCVICVDDLGTGFAGLRYLADLPVSVVKVDRSLVCSVSDPSIRKIIGAVCDISRTMGIAAVAEGVEDEGQIPALRDLGFTHAQGYFYGRPTPASQISEP
ncbi:EAL domain-containing protein [Dietzia kunjamensis]|uniref:EAL domain-containing protein n=1 Tax=Dietzia kunjamensis TaxID=322509 RepID=UPI002096AE0A|nr:EAL domain-containing protein [Dietzia kunjamensis]USX45176.1 EAL domain-containing protein [Dietzia kunjamensis]